MAKKVSVINMKGGVGKSTLTVNLAWHFAAYSNWQKKVLVVDLDPQFNSSQYMLGVTRYAKILQDGNPTVWEVFEQNTRTPSGKLSQIDYKSAVQNVTTYRTGGKVDLVPSRLELAFSLKNPGQKERQLSKLIAKLEDDYDLILIDCAPTESILTTAAYICSDYLLVPVRSEYLSAIGVNLLVNSMQDFNEDYEDKSLTLAGIVFNATEQYVPEEAKSKAEVRKIAAQRGWYVFTSEVPYSKSFPKGAREGKPIFSTSYSRSSRVGQFNKFAAEFAKRISL
jgi:chromosome partitioning protein